MSLDMDICAARRFYRAVRDFADNARPWHSNAIFYSVGPDEKLDLSLVSFRVYGRRDEFLAVLAAAGLDSFDQEIPQKTIALPNESQLIQFKRASGFESQAELRRDFAPVWGH